MCEYPMYKKGKIMNSNDSFFTLNKNIGKL